MTCTFTYDSHVSSSLFSCKCLQCLSVVFRNIVLKMWLIIYVIFYIPFSDKYPSICNSYFYFLHLFSCFTNVPHVSYWPYCVMSVCVLQVPLHNILKKKMNPDITREMSMKFNLALLACTKERIFYVHFHCVVVIFILNSHYFLGFYAVQIGNYLIIYSKPMNALW